MKQATNKQWFWIGLVLALLLIPLAMWRWNPERASPDNVPVPVRLRTPQSAAQAPGISVSEPSSVRPETAQDRLAEALLGQSDTALGPEARRLLGQALLSLENVHGTVRRFYAGASPRSSSVTVFHGYGRVLFMNDYTYAARACPELDPQGAGIAYTNALAALDEPGVLEAARETATPSDLPAGAGRLAAPMTDMYTKAFTGGLPAETTQCYSNVLAMLRSSVPTDPLSTDLFNDAIIYAMSKTEVDEMEAESMRFFSRVARWEAKGQRPSLNELEGPVQPADLTPPNVHASIPEQYVRMRAVYREIFGYRFALNHGITDVGFMDALSTLTVPATALWIHIQPPEP
ncbi:MAG: hypothetical protein FJ387_25645 [Verrucomicrobia bacterium]|nr:hypothetical protein [Verrucomicrobiota bacterium]